MMQQRVLQLTDLLQQMLRDPVVSLSDHDEYSSGSTAGRGLPATSSQLSWGTLHMGSDSRGL